MKARGHQIRSLRWASLAALAAVVFAASCRLARVAFSPDSKRFAAVVVGDPAAAADPAAEGAQSDPQLELWVTNVGTWNHQLVARAENIGFSATWSRDGRELYFLQGEKEDKLVLTRWNGTTTEALAETSLDDNAGVFVTVPPQLLPDGGALILTEADEAGTTRIVRCDVASKEKLVLAERAGGAVLSPQGDRIAYFTWETGQPPSALCIRRVDGGPPRSLATVLAKLKGVGLSPIAWSPDGKQITWVDVTEGGPKDEHFCVYRADVETGTRAAVSPPADRAYFPLFSTDGSSIFYTALTQDGRAGVRRAHLASGENSEVPGGQGCMTAGTSPDGRYLALRCLPESLISEGAGSVVRLVTLATGAFHDDWVTAEQRREIARANVKAAKKHAQKDQVAELGAALTRAEEMLAAMAKQFPGSEDRADTPAIRAQIEALRSAK